MSVPYFRAILPAMALALSTAGPVSANTINTDSTPAAVTLSPSQGLIVAVAQDDFSTGSFSLTIAGDYIAFEGDSSFFAASGVRRDDPIMLSFEVTSGYAPDTGILHAIRSLFGR